MNAMVNIVNASGSSFLLYLYKKLTARLSDSKCLEVKFDLLVVSDGFLVYLSLQLNFVLITIHIQFGILSG